MLDEEHIRLAPSRAIATELLLCSIPRLGPECDNSAADRVFTAHVRNCCIRVLQRVNL